MFKSITFMALAMAGAMSAGASESLRLPINEETLSCKSGILALTAPEVKKITRGEYAAFEARHANPACFIRNQLVDVAKRENGTISAEVRVRIDTVKTPIYKCETRPRPCPFCDHPFEDCREIGREEHQEETVYVDVYGIVFTGKSRLP